MKWLSIWTYHGEHYWSMANRSKGCHGNLGRTLRPFSYDFLQILDHISSRSLRSIFCIAVSCAERFRLCFAIRDALYAKIHNMVILTSLVKLRRLNVLRTRRIDRRVSFRNRFSRYSIIRSHRGDGHRWATVNLINLNMWLVVSFFFFNFFISSNPIGVNGKSGKVFLAVNVLTTSRLTFLRENSRLVIMITVSSNYQRTYVIFDCVRATEYRVFH